jgi:3-phosphoshikimate 1-carboxyvinyltransferase
MSIYTIKAPEDKVLRGEVTLNGSKSIANRALIIQALCEESFTISNVSNADDTRVLQDLLSSDAEVLDAGAGGTTFRFLTAYLATRDGREVVLTGSKRMQERPIKLLVDALRSLGADIRYEAAEGFPPLRIRGKSLEGGAVSIPADTSSQYISALLMIGPLLKNGLQLHLQGEVVSVPYILMTINLMRYFGAVCHWDGQVLKVQEGAYRAKDFFVEADWSAASYFYSMAMLAEEAEITLHGLSKDSVQGDAVVADIFGPWVESCFSEHSVSLRKKALVVQPTVFHYDFIECPDLAQTVVAALAVRGISAELKGLKTLLIKETDRVAALRQELQPWGISFTRQEEDLWVLDASSIKLHDQLQVKTYEDHRMAMSFAPLALAVGQLRVEEPAVVTKSYPAFWDDCKKLGFLMEGQ